MGKKKNLKVEEIEKTEDHDIIEEKKEVETPDLKSAPQKTDIKKEDNDKPVKLEEFMSENQNLNRYIIGLLSMHRKEKRTFREWYSLIDKLKKHKTT